MYILEFEINKTTYFYWDPLKQIGTTSEGLVISLCFLYTISWAFSENFYFKLRKAVHYGQFVQNVSKNYEGYFLIDWVVYEIQ